ncbi:Complement C2 [Varanus komodoensis]|nr:Complement C2 [Varanus komodoensis]
MESQCGVVVKSVGLGLRRSGFESPLSHGANWMTLGQTLSPAYLTGSACTGKEPQQSFWKPCPAFFFPGEGVLDMPLSNRFTASIATQESVLDTAPSCPTELSIRGGTMSLSDGYRPGSVLTYSCPAGTYAYPSRKRICQSDGKWTPMRLPNGVRTNIAQCKAMHCPPQKFFEHGSFSPRRNYHPIGDVLSFECSDGYQLLGSAQRHCLPNGRWNGTSPVCDDGVGHCRSIAVPPGAIASRGRNGLGDRVSFQCQSGLDLIGSSQRICTLEGEWSGAEPSCRAPYSYDRAEDVRAEFGASLTYVLGEVSSSGPDPSGTSEAAPDLGRRLILSKDSFLYIYFLVDASDSVGEDNFSIFKECLDIIITRLASFDVFIKISVISYASQPRVIVSIYDDTAEDPEVVLEMMKQNMNYKDHGNATGTNIWEAIRSVYTMMTNDQAASGEQWFNVRHAIILLTDGKSNMGAPPKLAVQSIEDFVNVRKNRNDYLDVYVFGVGSIDVDWHAMNEIASKKPGERHAFKLQNSQELKKAFEDILDPRDLDDICGLANYSDNARWDQKNPWHVLLQSDVDYTCRGALISKTWVLTSAHCFNKLNHTASWMLTLGGGESKLKIKRRIDHELYNVRAKMDQGITEFYDYDISLLELEKPVQFGGRIRPICLPCTEGANRALKKRPGTTTCKDHGEHIRPKRSLEMSCNGLVACPVPGSLMQLNEVAIRQKSPEMRSHIFHLLSYISKIKRTLRLKDLAQLDSTTSFCCMYKLNLETVQKEKPEIKDVAMFICCLSPT